jgi:hypothetical protein
MSQIIHFWAMILAGEPQRKCETKMTIADMVYEQLKTLPEPLAREVLDFVTFLRERGDRQEWRDLMDAQATSLGPVWDSPEDKVWDNA